jgi:hypothetical protein
LAVNVFSTVWRDKNEFLDENLFEEAAFRHDHLGTDEIPGAHRRLALPCSGSSRAGKYIGKRTLRAVKYIVMPKSFRTS